VIEDPTAAGVLSPGHTALVVFVVLATLSVALAWAIFSWRMHVRRAADALASMKRGALPARGAAVLHGVVETEDPERPAITVTLSEQGEEHEVKDGWVHTWTEIGREVHVEPFYLKLTKGGTIVRVEPGDDVFLVDALEPFEGGNPRKRRARLTSGETAYVSGVVGPGFHARVDAREGGARDASAYRGGAASGLVLRSGRDRMLVSTEPLDGRFTRLAKAHRAFTIVLGVALAVASTLAYGPAIAMLLLGKTVDAEVTGGRTWTTTSKGTKKQHFGVTARYLDAQGRVVQLEGEVNADVYARWKAKMLPRQTFLVAFDSPWASTVGDRPTIDPVTAVVPPFLVMFILLLYGATVRGAREWYDQEIVKTRGQGRLS
jgi:hypothetical protein